MCCISLSQIRSKNLFAVEWYIEDDKDLYQKFFAEKDAIEKEMGLDLDWRELPGKKASRILVTNYADFNNKDKWAEQFDWAMDVALKMKKSFKKRL